MNHIQTTLPTAVLLIASATSLFGQSFNAGSNGSLGALDIGPGGDTSNPHVLNMPPDGIFHFTTIRVASGWTLRFVRNALNTPVYLLATGDVLIQGDVDVNGSTTTQTTGGAGGPGGFDGGTPLGAGKGPGAGSPGDGANTVTGAGIGAYAPLLDAKQVSANNGIPYGSPLLIPMVGGSGGGGNPQGGGGGGGGAILIGSNTRIEVTGTVTARGGFGFRANAVLFDTGFGSGGAIRLVAPVVAGGGILAVHGAGNATTNPGRIRVDTIDRTGIRFNTDPVTLSLGTYMTVFPPEDRQLRIIGITGTTIPENSTAPVNITLPFGSNPQRTITIQARNFGAVVPVEIVLTPNEGAPIKVNAQISNVAANPATAAVSVAFPINTPVNVAAWVR